MSYMKIEIKYDSFVRGTIEHLTWRMNYTLNERLCSLNGEVDIRNGDYATLQDILDECKEPVTLSAYTSQDNGTKSRCSKLQKLADQHNDKLRNK